MAQRSRGLEQQGGKGKGGKEAGKMNFALFRIINLKLGQNQKKMQRNNPKASKKIEANFVKKFIFA